MFTNVLYVSGSIFFPFKRTIEQKFVLVFRRLHAFVANLSTFVIPLLQIVLHIQAMHSEFVRKFAGCVIAKVRSWQL